MNHFLIRRDGLEFPVAGAEALLRLVHDGALSPRDRVRDPEHGAWCAAGDMEILKEAFAARIAAAEARRAQSSRPRPVPVPTPGPSPLLPLPPPVPEPPATAGGAPSFAIPDDLLHPGGEGSPTPAQTPSEPPTPLVPRPSAGSVLSFPTGGPAPNLAVRMDPLQAKAAIEDPDAFLRQDREGTPRRREHPGVRPWLVLITAFVVVVCAFLVVTWVQKTAGMRYATISRPVLEGAQVPVASVLPAATPAGAVHDPSVDAFYDSMELALRDRLMPGCMTISKEDDLDTALRVELSRLDIRVQSIHAPVITWGGRHADVPLAVEIRLWYEGQPDQLDRELGAIGMVVGKYAQNYSLDVHTLEVFVRDAQGETRARSLDPAAARQLYLRRRSLLGFLTAEAG